MRKLNQKQKEKIKRWYYVNKRLDINEKDKELVASLNWYETVYDDIDRYLNDFYFEEQSKNRDLF